MKSRFSLIFSVLFFFAIQMQSLTSFAHMSCDQQHSEESEHDSKEQSTEACNQQHHCCHTSSTAYQIPKLNSQFLNLDIISFNFPSLNELAIEAPTLEGPFQPPRV
jgi:hypothetical protein